MSIEELTNTEEERSIPSLSEMIKKSMPKLGWKPSTESVAEENETPELKTVKKRAPRNPRADAARRAADDEEAIRKRDILVSVSVLGELEGYVGENIPAAKIRTMDKQKLEVLYSAYEAKLGQEMTQDGMEAVVGTAVKAIGFLVPLDDVEALKGDLQENKPSRRSLGRHCASVAERYGDLVAFTKVIYDVVKHIKFEEKPTFQVVSGSSHAVTVGSGAVSSVQVDSEENKKTINADATRRVADGCNLLNQ